MKEASLILIMHKNFIIRALELQTPKVNLYNSVRINKDIKVKYLFNMINNKIHKLSQIAYKTLSKLIYRQKLFLQLTKWREIID